MPINISTWTGLKLILLLYSSKYLVNPPCEEGIETLSCAIFKVKNEFDIKIFGKYPLFCDKKFVGKL